MTFSNMKNSKPLSVVKEIAAVTFIAVSLSVLIYFLITVAEGRSSGGFLRAFLIPLIISPVLSIIYFRHYFRLVRSEQELKKNLSRYELNIREGHHRIKNNLSLIISLINLQKQINNDSDNNSFCDDLINRIKAISLLHEELYQSDDIALVNVKEFAERIIREIVKNLVHSNIPVDIDISGDDFYFESDVATTFGLLISELTTNSVKHGFSDQRKNQIYLECRRESENFVIIYGDNGSGILSGKDVNVKGSSKSLGMTLIDSLAKQMHAEIERTSENGLRYRLVISKQKLQKSRENRNNFYQSVLFSRNIMALTRRILQEGISDKTYSLILDYAMESISAAEKGSITRLMSDGRYHFAAASGFNFEKLSKVSFSENEILLKPGEKKPRIISNIQLIQKEEGQLDDDRIVYLRKYGYTDLLRHSIVVPIQFNGRIGAMLNLNSLSEDNLFDEQSVDIASVFASQIGLVFEYLEK